MNERGAVPLAPQATGAIAAAQAAYRNGRWDVVEAGYLPWNRASRQAKPGQPNEWAASELGDVPVPQEMIDRMRADLPPVIRRTQRQRYEALVQRLVQDGMATYKLHGYPVWPGSIARVLETLGFKAGNTDLQGQVKALAAYYIEKGQNRQKEKDGKKVVLDWHGHHD